MLIGLAGAGTSIVMQLRQVLTSPAVAQDEVSLTADAIMRVEDACALAAPDLLWSLPAIFLARHGHPMIVIDAASPTPPFEQLRAQLARQIQDRSLAVGTRLPPIRRLAADLGPAVNTVGRAYLELEEAGLIETRERAGSFVSAAGEPVREQARRAPSTCADSWASLSVAGSALLSLNTALIAATPFVITGLSW